MEVKEEVKPEMQRSSNSYVAKKNKIPTWTMTQLETVLNYLKKNKSRGPLGYANELFHDDVAGNDLRIAILEMLNRIKTVSKYTLKHLKKGFESYRGIFRVPIFQCILDRLIYNDEYSGIDSNLSGSNVGARRNRNIRDNIFVLIAITITIL